mmetsp:Transcript_6798/g.8977  ORF Transcript_6798/g.8977 Transcript_6798/m.8977 type:complete len:427 (-) Transcript_6798:191-1471(-)
MKHRILPSILAIASAALVYRLQPYFDKDIRKAWDYAERCFSSDYYDARALFRMYASSLNLEMHSIPLDIPDHDDLTIDVAIYRGNEKNVLIHMSGTHGVEGFAGSAVQSSILGGEKRKFWQSAVKFTEEGSKSNNNLPTVVFVHALNPYGFAKLRRWNENNVDLNRNFLNTQQFIQRLALDANRHGYVDFYDLFNPPAALGWMDPYLPLALYNIIKHGYANMKKSVVTGSYHHPKGIFYGGSELQQSNKLLSTFLQNELDVEQVDRVGLVDVHTGLGPKGFDTIIAPNDEKSSYIDRDVLVSILQDDNLDIEKRIVAFGKDSSAASGYGDVVGTVEEGIGSLFSNAKKAILLCQEFGTINPIFVSQALREENAAYWHAPGKRIEAAQRVRGAFYLHNDPQWKTDIVTRGADVFWKMFKYLESNEYN